MLSYLNEGLHLDENDLFFGGHTNKWEYREIAHTLHNLGYNVDGIHFLNDRFVPKRPYHIAIDIHGNLSRLKPHLPQECKKVVHATGSYVPSLIACETARLAELKIRRGATCRPRRGSDTTTYDASLAAADHVSLIGNAVTLSTYPAEIQTKTTCLNASASVATGIDRTSIANPRAFVWLGGGGAVLKGLDLLLEIFGKRNDIRLHIVGGGGERDFARAYHHELFEADNIEFHGFLDLAGEEFRAIAEQSFAIIKPSASEGMSTAVTTAMTVGFYPIISRQTGIDLPQGSGMYLEDLSLTAIETSIDAALAISDTELLQQISGIQSHAKQAFSRQQFSSRYKKFLTETVLA
ncbi:MAG: glycosyltransferase [Hyphomicrobiales bacterium]|nr:glycosyltransferase [Hyphomicrobiales bacterium]MCP4998559.1 glycosyltransferase [Hyphomicrobiales bacterium]